MKKLTLALLLASAGLTSGLLALGGGTKMDVRAAIGVATCTGANAQCPVTQTVNAPAFTCCGDVTSQSVTALGSITEKINKDLAIPSTAGEHTLFSFSPSQGELAGKTIYFGLELQPQRRGTAMAGKNVLFAFRQVEGSNDWQRVGIITDEKKPFGQTLGFIFKPNGDIAVQEEPTAVFNVGKKDLS